MSGDTTRCPTCRGAGAIRMRPDDDIIDCPRCHGRYGRPAPHDASLVHLVQRWYEWAKASPDRQRMEAPEYDLYAYVRDRQEGR